MPTKTVGTYAPPSPDPDLAQAATDAVKQWRYEPTLLNGDPIEIVTTIAVRFRLAPASGPSAP
ncbi:MAG: energy transducer TonB [Terriglobia bacterium]